MTSFLASFAVVFQKGRLITEKIHLETSKKTKHKNSNKPLILSNIKVLIHKIKILFTKNNIFVK